MLEVHTVVCIGAKDCGAEYRRAAALWVSRQRTSLQRGRIERASTYCTRSMVFPEDPWAPSFIWADWEALVQLITGELETGPDEDGWFLVLATAGEKVGAPATVPQDLLWRKTQGGK